jgi:multicomponent Na+:H+ antiporter subunit G
MNALDWLSIALLLAGLFFFLAGTVGLLRFPDVFTRLHALTKADNVGLGFTLAGLALQADSWATVAKLGLIWLLVLVASATVCFLIARAALRSGQRPWRAP